MAYKNVLLILCVLGALLPMSQFLPWLIDNGLNVPLFIENFFQQE